MARPENELRNKLTTDLQDISQETGAIFNNIADNYPELLQAFQGSWNDSQLKMSQLSEELGISGGGHSTFGLTMEVIKRVESEISKLNDNDALLFSALEKGIESFQSLDVYIERIRQDSSEMELISLNAMTVALKAGTSGRAFSYITEELKRISTKTFILTDQITELGHGLIHSFNEFKDELVTISERQKTIVATLTNVLPDLIEKHGFAMKDLNLEMERLLDKTKSLKPRLMEIMEVVQRQDIIKQSMDHVIFTLTELNKLDRGFDEKTRELDTATFSKIIPQLGLRVLTNIIQELRSSEKDISEKISNARDTIRDLEQERTYLFNRLNATQSGNETETFGNILSTIDNLVLQLKETMNQKERSAERALELLKEVKSLERVFKTFAGLINRFHSIDVASRIEVAKQEVLAQMEGTVDEMTELTDRIEADVDNSLESIRGFLESTSKTVKNYRNSFDTQRGFIKNQETKLRNELKTLHRGNDSISSSISSFSLFNGQFIDLFSQNAREINKLQLIADALDGNYQTLSQLASLLDDRYREVLNEYGETDWKVHSEHFQEILNKFTILIDKHLVSDLVGVHFESGTDPGEVTIF